MIPPIRYSRSSKLLQGKTLGALLALALALMTWLGPDFVVRLDDAALDLQFRLRGERTPGQNIVLVFVDEKSLNEIGRWPWPRDTQARLIERLAADGPAVIGLDVIYAEPDDSGRETAAPSENDRRLSASLAKAANVVLALPFFVPTGRSTADPFFPGSAVTAPLERSTFTLVKQTKTINEWHPYEAQGLLAPLDLLARQANGVGHVYRLPDHDGVTRREVLAVRYGEFYFPSFALEVARKYLNVPREHMALLLGTGVQLEAQVISTDQKLRMPINYAGRELRFSWVSATDVLHERVPAEWFHGKVVLVGTAALGTYDQISTPFSANFSGVEKHATVVENILDRRYLKTGFWSGPLDVGTVLTFGSLMAFVLPHLRALSGAGFALLVALVYAGTVQTAFVVDGLCLPVVMPMLAIGSVFTVTTVRNYWFKERQAREIHAMFSTYVSPSIVKELMQSPSKIAVGGQRRELTMMFVDLVGFTAFSEQRPAEAVVEQLNEYLAAMTDVIFRWNGTLDKFVGDAIVVFWGAPADQPNHAWLALQCAVEMRTALHTLHARWSKEGKPLLDNGIGINTGVALVGNIGAEGKKVDYTMIGDHVNLASRLQDLTRTLKVPILLSEFTAAKLTQMPQRWSEDGTGLHAGPPALTRLRVLTVKGRQEPVAVYTLATEGTKMAADTAAAG
jgi:adenylate cyclase